MDKKTMQFVLFSLVVMVLFGFLVRGVILVPKQAVAGPVWQLERDGHDEGSNTSCDICHRKEEDFHKETFGYFDDCMVCHGGENATPHGISGSFEFCLGCHEDIVPSHDEMFPFEKASYDVNCVGCHPPAN